MPFIATVFVSFVNLSVTKRIYSLFHCVRMHLPTMSMHTDVSGAGARNSSSFAEFSGVLYDSVYNAGSGLVWRSNSLLMCVNRIPFGFYGVAFGRPDDPKVCSNG